MAIVPIMTFPAAAPQNLVSAAKVQAWTEQASEALRSVNLATESNGRVPRGGSVRLSIPLDQNPKTAHAEESNHGATRPKTPTQGQVHTSYGKRTLMRRDSLDRREALLKGKEGSRQRRRWENDRLLSNPWAQPPLPSDWEVRPTYPRRSVPYYLAPLWDAAEFQRGVEEKMKGKAKGVHRGKARLSPAEEAAANIPREVRARLKRARAAKGLLQDLEEEVRLFLQKWGEKEASRREDGLHDVDSEEEEIVFVGRGGVMHDSPGRKEKEYNNVERQKMLFEGMADDKGAGFGRWLVHSIATYYGLQTWSVTVGNPARREAYVGVGEKNSLFAIEDQLDLPRPLWGMV